MEAPGRSLLLVAFCEESEDAALVRGGVSRVLVDGEASGADCQKLEHWHCLGSEHSHWRLRSWRFLALEHTGAMMLFWGKHRCAWGARTRLADATERLRAPFSDFADSSR